MYAWKKKSGITNKFIDVWKQNTVSNNFFFFYQCSILQKNLFCMQSLFFLSPACNEESFQTTKRPTEWETWLLMVFIPLDLLLLTKKADADS